MLKQEDSWVWGQPRLQFMVRPVLEKKKKNLKGSINIRMNKQNMIHTNNGIWLSLVREEVLTCDLWMDLEDITPSEKTGYKGTNTVCFYSLEVSTVTKYIKIEGRCQGQGCAMEGFGDLYSTAPKSFTAPSRVWVWEAEALWGCMVMTAVQQCEFT